MDLQRLTHIIIAADAEFNGTPAIGDVYYLQAFARRVKNNDLMMLVHLLTDEAPEFRAIIHGVTGVPLPQKRSAIRTRLMELLMGDKLIREFEIYAKGRGL